MAKVLIMCFDVIGKSMAGPAIRCFEIAKELSKEHEVVLTTVKKPDIEPEGFVFGTEKNLDILIPQVDVIITSNMSGRLLYFVDKYRKSVIIDVYGPQALEHLEIFKTLPARARKKQITSITRQTRLLFHAADGVICASRFQKDLWVGFLMAQKLITPQKYDKDPAFDRYVVEVPFGLSPTPPQKTGEGMRKKFGLKNDDFVLLWGGGIWNWFDPLSLIKAVHLASLTRSDIKLVFMGIKHPNSGVPEMQMTQDAVNLARELKLIDKHIFFNFGWVPYEERQSFLIEANAGVSTHCNHLETRYSFRTRILDYLWASLPILCTEGDYFAELVEKESCGIVVPFENPKAIKEAIFKMADNPDLRNTFRQNAKNLSKRFEWPLVLAPLKQMISNLCERQEAAPKLMLNHIQRMTLSFLRFRKSQIIERLKRIKSAISAN